MRQAGVEGEVHLTYVVDTIGKVQPGSMKILRSTHELFVNAVKRAIPLQEFTVPRRSGVSTSVQVEEAVVFDQPGPGDVTVRPVQLSRRGVDSTGRVVTTVYAFFPRDSVNAPVLTRADSLEIHVVVVEELMRSQDAKQPPAAWCVHLAGRDPSAAMFEQWRHGSRKVVAMTDCPRTYDSMIHSESAPKPPPGWIDPVIIGVHTIVSWAEDRVVLTAHSSQGTSGTIYKCEVGREAGKWGEVYCTPTARTIS